MPRPSITVALAVVLAVCLLGAGCLGVVDAPGDEQTPTTTSQYGTVTYPDLPAEWTNDSLREFALAYEESHVVERVRERAMGEIQRIDYSVSNVTVEANESSGTVVHLQYMVGVRAKVGGGNVVASDTRYSVTYRFDEGRVWRASETGLSRPDQHVRTNGTRVAA
ncbi:hypothetical protein [Haloarchaeobius sp. DFWS5]|uniref:hypothetical protein n=1 Tax=Haloarchaeobius sp. DFWS5 TaxID=3446114 RepID=UPI003EBBF061